jgi:tetratricopeptide (TPR) repeat protein
MQSKRLDKNNPWLVGIISGLVVTILGGAFLYFIFQYPKEKAEKELIVTSLESANKLLSNNICEEALIKYKEIIKTLSKAKEPEIYAEINNNVGICYEKLADKNNKEENLKQAIDAYEEALKIFTLEIYPVDYAITQDNLGTAYRTHSEVRDKEENLQKAIHAYEEALKIRTVERYPLFHNIVLLNMKFAKRQLSSW